ncbi:MAG: hypothetical protein ACI4SL_03780, partial [Candidatus Ornithospirochaeta sp.]
MTALENMWIELYMSAMVSIIFLLGLKKRIEKKTSSWYYRITLMLQIAVLLSDVVLWYFEYLGSGIFILYEIIWTLNFILFALMVLYYSLYLYAYVAENYGVKTKYPVRYFFFILIVSLCLWVSSYWNELIFVLHKDFYPTYSYLYGFVLFLIMILMIPDFIILIKARKKMEKRMLFLFSFYSISPIIALSLETILEIDCIFYSSTCLSLLLIYVGVSQKSRMIAYNQSIEIEKKESELRETEQKVMMGNIQPLFIQSVLASIAD